jgi:hypothetical protein
LPTPQILLLQEPQLPAIPNTYHKFPPPTFSHKPRAAIVCHKSLQAAFIPQQSTRDICMVRVKFRTSFLILISIYAHKKTDIQKLLTHIPTDTLRRCIIAIDTNASSPTWGAAKTCKRGEILQQWLASTNLYVLNQIPHPPSFQQSTGSSFIDATICSSNMLQYVHSWKPLRREHFLSGHTAFTFTMDSNTSELTHSTPRHEETSPLWHLDFRTIEKEKFIHTFKSEFWPASICIHHRTRKRILTKR